MTTDLMDNLATTLRYKPRSDAYDEACMADGTLRPHWQYLIHALREMGSDNLLDRQLKANRILRDDGASYNLWNASGQERQLWGLDPIPLLIESEQWREIESGILERAELFNLILTDLHGPMELLSKKILPAELIFSSPDFLRPCFDLRLPGEQQLILHSANMVRMATGELCVISDRTQAPSGAGYALENRIVMSRVFPSLFRDSQVHRLAPFFRSLRNTLHELAPANKDQPNVVILTPGSLSETYFEHSYLANYLGFPLVQGEDLTVKNGVLWMNSLDGLIRVDVLLRRVDDYYCDPVELKSDSQLGVPGLLQVARAGRVSLVNLPGSGILEHPGLLKYLPDIGRYFLGREPRIGSAPTWWCGDPKDCQHVLANLPRLLIKPVRRGRGTNCLVGAELDESRLAQLRQDIMADPTQFVAQQHLCASTSPVLDGGQLAGRGTVLRSFAVAAHGDYILMPGGLTRVGGQQQESVISNQTGSLSKDTWVLASEPEKQITLWQREPLQSKTDGSYNALSGRSVDNLFWMGRYAERAEMSMRLLRTVLMLRNRNMDTRNETIQQGIQVLLRSVTQVTTTYPGFLGQDSDLKLGEPDEELLSVVLDGNRVGSVTSNVLKMLQGAFREQNLLSADMQRVINDINDEIALLPGTMNSLSSAPEEALDPLITYLMALSGLAGESMGRDMGWRFLELGKRIERSLMTISLLRSTLVRDAGAAEPQVFEAVLLITESLITYRHRYRFHMEAEYLLELLLFDTNSPRSLLFQLSRLETLLKPLPKTDSSSLLSREQRWALKASNALKLNAPRDLAVLTDGQGMRFGLDSLMEQITNDIEECASAIAAAHFAHDLIPRQLVNTGWGDDA